MRAQKIFATLNRDELQCSQLFLNCETISQFTTHLHRFGERMGLGSG